MNTTTANGTLPGIFPNHAEQLRASGLSDDTIREAGIYSEARHAELAALLNWKSVPKKMGAALVFPFGSNGYARVRPDNPRSVGGRPAKYESPRGQPNHVYTPAGAAHVLTDPAIELLVTEGEKKALKATQEGFATLGLVGVFGWKEKHRAGLLPELERVAWQGRPVFLVFDSDAADKPDVRDAESQLTRAKRCRRS